MYKIYMVGFPSYIESDPIEIRYSVYEDETLVTKRSIKKDYQKPVVVSLYALHYLLKELKKSDDQEMLIYMNEPAITEQLKGTTTTKNVNVLKLAGLVREQLKKFDFPIEVVDISQNKELLKKWDEVLKEE